MSKPGAALGDGFHRHKIGLFVLLISVGADKKIASMVTLTCEEQLAKMFPPPPASTLVSMHCMGCSAVWRPFPVSPLS